MVIVLRDSILKKYCKMAKIVLLLLLLFIIIIIIIIIIIYSFQTYSKND